MNYQITNILKNDKSHFPQSILQVTITKISQVTESLPFKGSLHSLISGNLQLFKQFSSIFALLKSYYSSSHMCHHYPQIFFIAFVPQMAKHTFISLQQREIEKWQEVRVKTGLSSSSVFYAFLEVPQCLTSWWLLTIFTSFLEPRTYVSLFE